MSRIKTVCVIGAGVMGSAIAAQVANSKTNVILLDVADHKSSDKNKIVNDAYNKLFTQKPPPLSHPDYAKYIKLGNLEDDITLIKEADLIIEVIIEKPEIKHGLYASISKYLKPTAILASNTSTLPLLKLKEKLPDDIKKRFVITHFFNPPRYMELLELVSDGETLPAVLPELSLFLTETLGKTIVNCNDTPGFIANRIGCFLLELVVRKGIKENLDPVIIDRIFSNHLGFPSTGIFGLYDLIGHDVMDLISKSLLEALPDKDRYHYIYTSSPVLEKMREKNLIGRKAGSGFYKLSKDENGKTLKQVIDFSTISYSEGISSSLASRDEKRESSHPEFSSGSHGIPGQARDDKRESRDEKREPRDDKNLEEVLNSGDKYSNFIMEVLEEFFLYVISLIPSVTNNKNDIDQAMKLGYSLKHGPFELLEKMPNGGLEWLKSRGINTIIPDNVKSVADKEKSKPPIILSNNSAELQSQEDHYVFVIKSKMNVLDTDVFNLIIEAVNYCENRSKPLYVLPLGNNFSAGASLSYFKEAIINKELKKLEEFVKLGQRAMLALKYAKIPVIACARGVALGGGCEILLHSSFVVAHQNLNAGLVELGVGLIPGWGGTKEMFLKSKGDRLKLVQNLKNILTQNKSSSADYFSSDYSTLCAVNMNKNLILQQAFEHATNFTPQAKEVVLPQIRLASELDLKGFDELQLDIIEFFQKIIDKKFVTEQELLDFECDKFLELAFKPLTLERVSKFV